MFSCSSAFKAVVHGPQGQQFNSRSLLAMSQSVLGQHTVMTLLSNNFMFSTKNTKLKQKYIFRYDDITGTQSLFTLRLKKLLGKCF
ncbi:hypothetical protein EXN66_Car003948 [Channa argus]|uniref:Uncharacterized protein n=1 Tax=Channa argus TaxID=215402 RepID=A0A6G1PE18_CHAAH|nr:hypothetical protein EXN66_Car003948 [Channa argus]